MKKHGFFSAGLYLQTLWRLRIFGASAAAIVTALNLLSRITFYAHDPDYIYPASYYMPFLPLAAALAPVFAFLAFSFLFSRAQSDLYHSLCVPRAAAYVSTAAAALTWTWGITLLSGFANYTVCIYNEVNNSLQLGHTILSGIAQCLLAGFMLTAFSAFAASLTGTVISAVMTFLASCTVLRVILYAVSTVYFKLIPIISVKTPESAFLDPSFFAPMNVLLYDQKTPLDQPWYLIYNFIVAIVIAAVGCALFVRRQSDAAEKPAVSRKAHLVISLLIALPMMIYGASRIMENFIPRFVSRVNQNEDPLREGIIWIAAAVVLYIAYQLLTQKSVKKTAASLLYLLIPIFACAAVVSVSMAAREYVYSQKIEAEDIEAVMPAQSARDTNAYWSIRIFDPDPSAFGELHFTNNELATIIVADGYKRAVDYDLNSSREISTYRLPVKIKLKGGREVTRSLYIEDPNKIRILYEAAAGADGSLMFCTTADIISPLRVRDQSSVLNVFQEELSALDNEEKEAFFAENRAADGTTGFFAVRLTGTLSSIPERERTFTVPYYFYETRAEIAKRLNSADRNEVYDVTGRMGNITWLTKFGISDMRASLHSFFDYQRPNDPIRCVDLYMYITNGETGDEYTLSTRDSVKAADVLNVLYKQEWHYSVDTRKCYATVKTVMSDAGNEWKYIAVIPLDEEAAKTVISLASPVEKN